MLECWSVGVLECWSAGVVGCSSVIGVSPVFPTLSPGFYDYKRNLIKASARRMYFVPEGQHDRSLARSAWESVHRENRPVGYGMIGHSYPRTGISRRRCAPCCRIRNFHRIGAHAGANQTVPYGTAP